MATQKHSITILRGDFDGLRVARYLLRHTIPVLQAADGSKMSKVTLVSPLTHFFFKVGAPPRLCSAELAPVAKASQGFHSL